jgi:DNA-binding PadR family transcriptional regulator
MFHRHKHGGHHGPHAYLAMWGHIARNHRGRGFGGGEGRGRRRMFDGGELRLVLLKLIEEAPRHGYDLIREIEERSGGAYAPSPGVIYPTLTLLSDMGLIAEAVSDGAKKQFAVTHEGTVHLTENTEAVEAAMAKLAAMGEARQRTDGMQVRRAMGNLREAIQIRLSRDDVTVETLHAVTALLDEAAQKIERL